MSHRVIAVSILAVVLSTFAAQNDEHQPQNQSQAQAKSGMMGIMAPDPLLRSLRAGNPKCLVIVA